jgi:hypothetical protein
MARFFRTLSLNAPWNWVAKKLQNPRKDPVDRDESVVFIRLSFTSGRQPINRPGKQLIEKISVANGFSMTPDSLIFGHRGVVKRGKKG